MGRGNWQLSELGRRKLREIDIYKMDRSVFNKERGAKDLLTTIHNLKKLEMMSIGEAYVSTFGSVGNIGINFAHILYSR